MPPPKIKEWIMNNYKPEVDMTKVPLHFTAEQDGSSVSLVCRDVMEGDFIDSWCEFEYSMTGKDDDWKTYDTGSVIPLNKDKTVYFRCPREKDDTLNKNKYGFYRNYGDQYHYFVMKGSIKADGNIQFLLENTGTKMDIPEFCYYYMFKGCTALTQAPILPATTFGRFCYCDMFKGCTALTQAPELPATTLVDSCYNGMFKGCTSLTQAPVLPAETLANDCYNDMFKGCTSLTQAPVLPSTTLAYCCYDGMFDDCTSIPEPKYKMPNLTFDEVASEIQNNWIFGSEGEPYEVQCSDKKLVATFDAKKWQWTITEG